MPESQIYLSVVVTARNDDHGGSLLSRMQAFVNGWIGQCRRHSLSSELIVVDWNPPTDRPPLIEALRWPGDTQPCDVRFIQVPPAIHQTFRHAEHLPLYQMIAKNVGIRRARGQFILVTNIDILFSDELVRFLAGRRLESGRMYRIDRHDVMSDVPVEGSVEEQLEYCRNHLIRLNAREGTFPLTTDGLRALSEQDIAAPESGITFGGGWYGVERLSPEEVFRWVSNDAEVSVKVPPGCPPLIFDLEPGPCVRRGPFQLQVLNADSAVVANTWVRGRCRLELQLPSTASKERFFLHTVGGSVPILEDPRILNFRVYRCEWAAVPVPTKSSVLESNGTAAPSAVTDGYNSAPTPAASNSAAEPVDAEYAISAQPISSKASATTLWRGLRQWMEASGRSDPDAPMALPIPAPIRRAMYAYYNDKGVSGVLRFGLRKYFRPSRLVASVPTGQDVFDPASNILPGRGWYDLEHFRDETFRWVQNDAELIVQTPKGESPRLALHIEPGPGLEWKPFELVVREADSIVARARVKKLQYLEVPLSLQSDLTHVLSLHVEGGDRPSDGDSRHLNFRIFRCGWADAPLIPESPCQGASLPNLLENGLTLGAGWQPSTDPESEEAFFVNSGSGDILVRSDDVPRVLRLEIAPGDAQAVRLEVRDKSARIVASGNLLGRQICYLTLPVVAGPTHPFTLSADHGSIRLFRLGWASTPPDITEFASGLKTTTGWSPLSCTNGELFRIIPQEAELELTMPGGLARHVILELEATTEEAVTCSISDTIGTVLAHVSVGARRSVRVQIPWQPGTRAHLRLTAPQVRVYRCSWSACAGEPERGELHFRSEGVLDPHRDVLGTGVDVGSGWYRPECSDGDVYRWASSQAEFFLPESRKPRTLTVEIEAGPGLDSDSFLLEVLDRSWYRIGEYQVHGRQELQIKLNQQVGWPNVYRFVVQGAGLPCASDPRTLDFRVFRMECAEEDQSPNRRWAAKVMGRRSHGTTAAGASSIDQAEHDAVVHLHTNACGDFTLMSRDHWFDLRAYPEFDMYSFHIDSVLCYAAHHGGAREEILQDPMRVYHIEHGLGSGWTPEGQAKLFERLRTKGIPWIEYQELVVWAAQMRKLHSPMIFNRENWGLAGVDLPEMRLATQD